jgi:formylglycine-generating enzyme required for sulfatase activity
MRGGSWGYSPEYCRVAYRDYGHPSDEYADAGFRVVFIR